ncbi:glycosyltransferase [uncultured Bacteroides sp.]|uniref:glycosyltransferase n=1 Tax=uncultured Bacteroides sp. TaxID=162156 RepID=UPI002AAC4AA7|nr:glycosyltransferase [uncultured Bacteroides sp.]
MPNLFQINVTANWGSTGRIASEIGQMAIRQGWKSYIAYGRNGSFCNSDLIRIGTDFDVNCHILQTRFFDRHGLGSEKATKRLIEQIKKIKPDIVHLHNIHGYYLNIEVLFSYLHSTDIPVVWTLHDCWPMTGHCTHFERAGCDKWIGLCFECPLTREYPASFYVDRSEKNYILKKKLFNSVANMTLVPVSEWLSGVVKGSYLSEYPVKVINNGIDTDVFSPGSGQQIRAELKIGDSFLILGMASVWGKRKGFDDFMILSQFLPKGCRLLMVGLNSEQIKQLPVNVTGLPRTEDVKRLAAIYSAADLFLNPTWEDTFPTTNLEALACGTPVLTYRTGGSADAVTPETGFVVEQGDIDGIIDAVNVVREKGKTFYSNVCRKRALTFFDKSDRYEEYLKLYNDLIKVNN